MNILLTISNFITRIREVVGIDLCFDEEGKPLVSGLHVRFVKGKLSVVAIYAGMETLKEKMPRNVPLVVTVNGKGILMREIADSDSNPINQLFPGANPNDFSLFPLKLHGHVTYSFICRKVWIEETGRLLETEGLQPVLLVPGLTFLPMVLPFLEGQDIHIVSPSYKIAIEKGVVTSIAYGPQNTDMAAGVVDIGDMRIRKSQVPLLSAILQALLKPVDQLGDMVSVAAVATGRQHYRSYRFFNFSMWSVLSLTLTLLLINFFVFSHFFRKNKMLSEEIDQIRSTVEIDRGQQAAADSSYSFFNNAGWARGTKHGYYVDRISALVPPSVQLTMLQTAYNEEAAEAGGDIYKADRIRLKGISSDPTALESFSRAVKNIPGVELVTLSDYLFKRELAAAVFSIEIVVHI